MVMGRKKFLGFVIGGSLGFGLPSLVLKKDPLMVFLAMAGWIVSCVVIWFLFEREKISRGRSHG